MAKIDDVLTEIRMINAKLYGEGGFEGDIPQIRKSLGNYGRRIRKVEIIVAGIIGSGALTGGVIGLIRLLG